MCNLGIEAIYMYQPKIRMYGWRSQEELCARPLSGVKLYGVAMDQRRVRHVPA